MVASCGDEDRTHLWLADRDSVPPDAPRLPASESPAEPSDPDLSAGADADNPTAVGALDGAPGASDPLAPPGLLAGELLGFRR